MPPYLASLVFAAGTLGLFLLDRRREERTSPALWLPVIWLAIGGSRSVSQWVGSASMIASEDQYVEGSPLDRAILTGLIVIGLIVLIARGQRTGDVLKRNAPLVLFLLYCAASAVWSDFPLVTLKRWTKALGNFTMVLVVLTDRDAAAALKRLVTYTAFLLIPASVLFIKYYPELGRYYDRWEGIAFYSGVTADKNMLGCICMVLGLGILWRFVDTFREADHRTRQFVAVGTVLGMNLWLFHIANSATSLGCFMLGGTLVVILSLFKTARPWMVHLMVGGVAAVAVVAYLFQDAFAFLVVSMGRNTTLTGRTDLWNELIGMITHPWLGAGFESFFLGDRLEYLWNKYWWHPNEAHNGYLETYLTLGRVGLGLLGLLIATGYRNAIANYRVDPRSGALRIAYLVIAPIYNITEAAFKVMSPVWILFLLAATAVPPPVREEEGQKDSAQADPDRARGQTAGHPDTVNWGYRGPRPIGGRAGTGLPAPTAYDGRRPAPILKLSRVDPRQKR
jgi:exopolysaccharide production protein ExoQ